MTSPLDLTVNGRAVSREVEPRTTLADFVREELHLTGTHIGCEHGVCGACTLMIDGRPARSCLAFVTSCRDAQVVTIEGFADDPVMIRLRAAFSRHHALQCGYCTPGMLATAYDIVTRLPDADETRIREELAGNLCRCTGYMGIVQAIASVLADGPHVAAVRPRERPAPARTTAARAASAPPPAQPALTATRRRPEDFASAIPDGITLHRQLALATPLAMLWPLLNDVQAVARCLPGASVTSIGTDGVVSGAIAVALGPMRSRFEGEALVRFDEAARTGTIAGAGGDQRSRSVADGIIAFAARDDGAQGSILDLGITYKLKGPLAQFGRPAIVADVTDRLLAIFAANLAALATGTEPLATAPVGGISLLLGAIRDALRRLLSRDARGDAKR